MNCAGGERRGGEPQDGPSSPQPTVTITEPGASGGHGATEEEGGGMAWDWSELRMLVVLLLVGWAAFRGTVG